MSADGRPAALAARAEGPYLHGTVTVTLIPDSTAVTDRSRDMAAWPAKLREGR